MSSNNAAAAAAASASASKSNSGGAGKEPDIREMIKTRPCSIGEADTKWDAETANVTNSPKGGMNREDGECLASKAKLTDTTTLGSVIGKAPFEINTDVLLGGGPFPANLATSFSTAYVSMMCKGVAEAIFGVVLID